MHGIMGKWFIALLTASLAGAGAGTMSAGATDYPGGPSPSVAVTGAVQMEMTFAVPDLQALPTGMGTQGAAMHRGVLLKDVLDAATRQRGN